MQRYKFRSLAVLLLISIALNQRIANAEAVSLATDKDKPPLHGTLELPAGDGLWPVALIIGGSGPTDRDGNQPQLWLVNNHLKLLAEALTKRGIATLRFDKRGVGESLAATPQEKDLRFETYVEDAAHWGKQLRADKRFSSLFIIGHSEGSLIGIMATRKLDVAGLISVAGTGDRAGNLLREQLKKNLTGPLLQRSNEIIDRLERGEEVADVPAELMVLFRPSVQPYEISWFKIDPVVELRHLTCPVLLLQGTTDIQVTPHQAKLLAIGREGVVHQEIDGMNHVLKMVPDDRIKQLASYSLPNLPISEKLVDAIDKFVRAQQPRK